MDNEQINTVTEEVVVVPATESESVEDTVVEVEITTPVEEN
jgi:hypothetical protein